MKVFSLLILGKLAVEDLAQEEMGQDFFQSKMPTL